MISIASSRPIWTNLPGIGGHSLDIHHLFTLSDSPSSTKNRIVWSEAGGVYTPHDCTDFAPPRGFIPYQPRNLNALREIRILYVAKESRTHQDEMVISVLNQEEERLQAEERFRR